MDSTAATTAALDAATSTPEPTVPAPEVSPRVQRAEAARARAMQLMSEKKYAEAKAALNEADEAELSPRAQEAEAARARALQFMNEKRYAEAKAAMEQADKLEAPVRRWKQQPQQWMSAVKAKTKWPRQKPVEGAGAKAPDEGAVAEAEAIQSAVDQSVAIVNRQSKVAAAVGLLPGGLLNFGGVLAVQVYMVWKIANTFGHKEGKDRIRGSILSLVGSAIPTVAGHGVGEVTLAIIPAVLAGTVASIVVTPVLAYALTRAVGNAYIMHFESGGTLLTFDSKAFAQYFVDEYRKARGEAAPAAAEAAGTAN